VTNQRGEWWWGGGMAQFLTGGSQERRMAQQRHHAGNFNLTVGSVHVAKISFAAGCTVLQICNTKAPFGSYVSFPGLEYLWARFIVHEYGRNKRIVQRSLAFYGALMQEMNRANKTGKINQTNQVLLRLVITGGKFHTGFD
jgi:hypothetical protein